MLSAVSSTLGATPKMAVDPYVTDPQPASSAGAADVQGAPPFALENTLSLHSLPGADLIIYLDFDGHTTTGTAWNSGGLDSIVSPGFSADIDAKFNATELEYIQRVWQRVAEDFAPFNVDVTTELPGIEALRKSGLGDTQWGVRVVVTPDNSWRPSGGVAFLGSFSWDSDTPAFAFNGADSTSLFSEMILADTISHEVGHTLGLSHDGDSFQEYYPGHGLGATGWAPIMGAGFGQHLSQWSQGEYPGANNTEDDLAIITNPALNGAGWGYSGLTYKADDHSDSFVNTTELRPILSPLLEPRLGGSGLIETRSDVDTFFFDLTVGGSYTIDINPFERGANLDVLATLYNAGGALLAISNPTAALNATITRFLAAGRYYVRIDGTGRVSPGTDSGYSDYGSLGWYTVNVGITRSVEDNYENNDDRGIAADPRSNGGNWDGVWLNAINGVGRAVDDDWYVINVKPNEQRVTAELLFTDSAGDLDLFLVNAAGFVLARSESVTDNELIDFVVSAPGTYFLWVRPYAQELGNYYNLRWTDSEPTSAVNVAVSPNGTVEDGTENIVFTFTRSLDIASAVTVSFTVSGAAIFNSDYTVSGATTFTEMNGTVTFAAGSTTATVVINPTSDNVVELDEDVILTLTAGPGYEVGLNSSATSLILNDERARITITNASVLEGSSGTTQLVFTVRLDRAVDTGITFNFATADNTATAGIDYVARASTASLNGVAGEEAIIVITVNGDNVDEPHETLDLILSNLLADGRNVVFDRTRATGTILKDEFAPGAPTNVQASDNRNDFVALTWGAAAGADSYNILRSTVNDIMSATAIATGVAGTTYNDSTAAPAITYYYWVEAVNLFGMTTSSGSDTGIVLPTVSIAVAPPSILEDAAGTVIFTLTRNGSTAQALTIKVLLAGTARLGEDYAQNGVGGTASARTVTFAAGSATATVEIDPTADMAYEYDETVVLRIASDAAYGLGAKTAALSAIANDDPVPHLGLITAPSAGFKPTVLVYDATGQNVRLTIDAYADAFTRGVHVATGDVNNDGVFDVVVAPVSGVAPIKVFSGIDGSPLRSFLAFSDNFNADLNPSFAGGFSLAVGHVDADGYADIIVAPSSGAGPFVRVFSGKTGAVLRTFSVLGNEAFKGGINIAAGDADGDGRVELFATPASAAGPFVRVYNPLTGSFISSFWALPEEATGRFTGGLTVASGDMDGDGKAEVITGIASQGGPVVRSFKPLTGELVKGFLAFAPSDPQYFGGVNVGVSDFDGDGKAEIVVASRTQRSAIRVFNGLTGALITSTAAPYPTFSGGVFATGEVAQTVVLPAGMLASPPTSSTATFLSSSSSSTSSSGSEFSALPERFVASSPALDDLFADERQLDVLLSA